MAMFGPGSWGGQSSVQSNQAAGLPHAGVPGELGRSVDEVLAREPDHPRPDEVFVQVEEPQPEFSLQSFLRPHAKAMALAFLLVLVETIALQAGPLLTQIAIDDGIVQGNTDVLFAVAGAYAIAVAVGAFVTWIRILFTGRLGESLMYSLRVRVFSHLQRQPLGFFTSGRTGVLMTRMTSDIEALSILFQESLVNIAVQLLTLVVITVILFAMNAQLAMITICLIVPPTLILTLWFRKRAEEGYDRVRDRISDILSDLSESLAGIRVIAAHNRRRHNVIAHTNVVGDHLEANLYTAQATSIYTPATEAIGMIARAVLLFVGAGMIADGTLEIGELAAFILYLAYFFAPIQTLVQLYNTYRQGQSAVTKLSGLLGTEPAVNELENAVELEIPEGAITLDHVSFSYESGTPVLHDIDIHIRGGETIAVVGPTGAGKSTIAKLIARFYDPDSGTLSIDGQDISTVTFESLRSQLGVVPQEPFLFHGTIADNIGYGDPAAGHETICEVAEMVGLNRLIETLPLGIDSPVHERGALLSAGERQLIALARALLANPKILLLDEATSSLDLQSEATIEEALDVASAGRTAIIVAHRLTTAQSADRIAVVDGGSVTEFGTHAELIASQGSYAAMYQTWVDQGGAKR
jgi:ATP-binding cassette subfamily B protein